MQSTRVKKGKQNNGGLKYQFKKRQKRKQNSYHRFRHCHYILPDQETHRWASFHWLTSPVMDWHTCLSYSSVSPDLAYFWNFSLSVFSWATTKGPWRELPSWELCSLGAVHGMRVRVWSLGVSQQLSHQRPPVPDQSFSSRSHTFKPLANSFENVWLIRAVLSATGLLSF